MAKNNTGLTQADMIKQARYERACMYMQRVGVFNKVKFQLKGSTLTFKYNFQTPAGLKTFERRVNVDNFMYKDKLLRTNQMTGVFYNQCQNTFM